MTREPQLEHYPVKTHRMKDGWFFHVYSIECKCGSRTGWRITKSEAMRSQHNHEITALAMIRNAPEARIQGTMPMHINLEAVLLQAAAIVLSSTQANLNDVADKAADKLLDLVKSSETKIDDFAADGLSKLLRRISDRIDAGLQTGADAV